MPAQLVKDAEPIPGYKLISRLGQGGFGEVWKAEAPGGMLKAIKFVYGELEAGAKKGVPAEQELRALNRVKQVRHPFILSLEQVLIVDSQLVIVMELADCNLLDRFRYCQKQRFLGIPRDELLSYMSEAGEALDMMNTECQLQHLDVKPQNLFLLHNHIKVGDFGVVKDMEGMKASITGGVTPLYSAPETFEGWVSRYCDQYSLAIVYQELLTGRRPFNGANAQELLQQHVSQEPDVSPLPPGDQAVIRRALAKKPDERFPTCRDLVQALRDSGALASASRRPALPAPPAEPPRPGPGAVSDPTDISTLSLRAGGSTPRAQLVAETTPPGPVTPAPAPAALAAGPIAPAPAAPAQLQGPGVLSPTLMVALGQVGLSTLQQLREALVEKFGGLEAVPCYRLLYIDTDPNTVSSAAKANQGAALTAREMLLARVNRVTHFVKPREGQGPDLSWIDAKLLYRIPRDQLTDGFRFLGRLALVDNHREISGRLQTELAACAEPQALTTAEQKTQLGLRSNRPRVYVIASLGGGTGSGMFIDVAYLVRSLLKNMGYAQPEVVGLLFAALDEQQASSPLKLANSYGALAELQHFSTPGVTFAARYASKAPALSDAEPPFARSWLLPLEKNDQANFERSGVAASFVLRELTSPLGRAADEQRARLAPGGALLEAIGLERLTWPRRTLILHLARRLCLRLVQHWALKESAPVKAEVENWANDQWAQRQMSVEHLLGSLSSAANEALKRPADELFNDLIQKFGARAGKSPDAAPIRNTLDELVTLLGRPEGAEPLPQTYALQEPLDNAGKTLLAGCEQKLAEMAVQLIEQPKFRLAGAEEAIRRFNTLLQDGIAQQEKLAQEAQSRSADGYVKIQSVLETLKATGFSMRRKTPAPAPELALALRTFALFRLRYLLSQRLLAILRSLRGNCPEYLREMTYCRDRLGALLKAFEAPVTTFSALDLGPGRHLYPPGCTSLEDTIKHWSDKVSQADLVELDTRVQLLVRQNYTALVHICTTDAKNIVKDVELAVQKEAEAYVTERIREANVLDTFLAQWPQESAAQPEITASYQQAAPTAAVLSPAGKEFAVVVIPAESAAPRFRELVQKTVPHAAFADGPSGDDVIFYREKTGLALADLAPDAAKAYQQMLSTEHMTPHSRTDITDWQAPP